MKINDTEMKHIEIVTPQFERTWELDFDYIPKTSEEFIDTVTNAPLYILKGLGFCLWDTINSIAEENAKKPKHDFFSIEAYKLKHNGLEPSEEPLVFDLGHGDNPIEQQDFNEEVWLIPGEWYNVIPEGFPLTCITGRVEPFKSGETDDDIRFGCLAYGIRRRVS